MSSRNEWDAALDDYSEQERRRLGDPPTAEQLDRYKRGQLSEEERDRIRAHLAVRPELADSLLNDILTDDEVEADWQKLQRSLPRPGWYERQPLRIAAGVLIAVLAGAVVQSRLSIQKLEREREEPRVFSVRHELSPLEANRGAGGEDTPYPLSANEDHYLLVPLLYEDTRQSAYRVEVVDVEANRNVWSKRVALSSDAPLEISVPRAFFEPGRHYRLDLVGLDKPNAERTSYLLRVEAR